MGTFVVYFPPLFNVLPSVILVPIALTSCKINVNFSHIWPNPMESTMVSQFLKLKLVVLLPGLLQCLSSSS